MSWSKHFKLLAGYNNWINHRLYDCVSQVSELEQWEDKGAFFKSINGTLNHIMVGDLIWLSRFSRQEENTETLEWLKNERIPKSVKDIVCDSFEELRSKRVDLDQKLVEWIDNCDESYFSKVFSYTNTEGIKLNQAAWISITHLFNHQTHHRGQVTTILSQLGKDIEVTDLSVYAKNIED